MIDFSDLTKTVSESISNLTNVIGHIERNVKSYDNIRDRFRRKRLLSRLEGILIHLTEFRVYNAITIMHIAERAASSKATEVDSNGYIKYDRDYDSSLSHFLESLLDVQDILEEYHRDIIRVDYKLYDNLIDRTTARIAVVKMLRDSDPDKLSKDKLITLHEMYLGLVKHLEIYKEQVQALIASEGVTNSEAKADRTVQNS